MKFLVVFISLVGFVLSEPPSRFRQFGRQEAPQQPQAPYAPSGWRPAGAAFTLPSRQVQQTYGPPPAPTYGPPPPSSSYGPPPNNEYIPPVNELTTTEPPTTTVEDVEDYTEPNTHLQSLKIQKNKEKKAKVQQPAPLESGQFYLLLPDGRLQRVVYVTSEDVQNMAFNAKLRYESVQPIREPIYAFASSPYVQLAF